MLPLAALIASLVRWWMQGSSNVYTALDKRFYVPDPDLPIGWRISTEQPIWLGLEVCGIIAGLALGLAVGGWIIRRRERKTGRPAKLLRAAAWVAALIPFVVPIAAFTSGSRPVGGRDQLEAATAGPTTEGTTGSIAAQAGRYEVVAHEGTSITAQLKAGGEAFDARFARDITGTWQGDPRDLAKPMTAEVSVAAAAVDTGIGDRTKHAREGYLLADKHPRITFKLDKILATRQDGPDKIAFRAAGTLGFIGKTHAIEIAGTLREPDAAALGRLGVTGEVLLAQGTFSIVIKETALAADAGDFDGDRIPILVSLVLRHTGG